MQGQSPAVSISAQTGTTSPTQNANKEWTCQRWFNNIATKVSAKTHRYVGRIVAVVTLPIIFIPSLARDLFCGTKNLFQRVVSKAPVVNQVSTKGTSSSTSAATHSVSTIELPPVVQPDSVRAHSCHTPRTIEQLRKDFPELNQVFSAMEASAEEIQQQLAEYKAMNGQLKADLAQSQLTLSNFVMECDRLEKQSMKFKLQLEESLAKNYRSADNINELIKHIEVLKTEVSELLATNHSLARRSGSFSLGRSLPPKLDCVVKEPSEKDEPQVLSCPDEPHSSDQVEVIILEKETTSTPRSDAEPVDVIALNEAIVEPEHEDQDESVLHITTPGAQASQESSLTEEASDSDDSFETITESDVAKATGIPDIIITDFDQPTEVAANVE